MMFVILVAAIGLALSGLLVIAYGFAVQLSTGNTMIMAGVVSLCTGVIMLGFWTTVRELRAISRKLGSGAPLARGDAAALADEADPEPALVSGFPPAEPAEAPLFSPAAPPPWQNDSVLRDHPIPEPTHPEPAPAPKQKRNLLFSSSRRDRARAAEPFSPELLSSELRRPPSLGSADDATEPSPTSFQEGWSRSERVKPAESPLPRRGGRTPPPLGGIEDPASPEATVLKSGIVDGMAYSLFSDGSIEAQMPEGMMRFASIDELRAHLDQRS